MKREKYILTPNMEVLSDYYKKIDYWYQIDVGVKGSVRVLDIIEKYFLN